MILFSGKPVSLETEFASNSKLNMVNVDAFDNANQAFLEDASRFGGQIFRVGAGGILRVTKKSRRTRIKSRDNSRFNGSHSVNNCGSIVIVDQKADGLVVRIVDVKNAALLQVEEFKAFANLGDFFTSTGSEVKKTVAMRFGRSRIESCELSQRERAVSLLLGSRLFPIGVGSS